MAEVNRLCVRILVHEVDVKENPESEHRRRESLRESVQAPVTCLVGTMETLCEAISHLPLLQRPFQLTQINAESTADDDVREKVPRPTSQKNNKSTEQRDEELQKMAEFYRCPLLKEIPAPLPNNTSYNTIVTRVVQAQRHLVHKPQLKASFQSFLTSPTMENFVIDSFWWLFLQKFQPDRKTQDRLFCQIAENYIRILTQNLCTHSGTRFLRDFSSTLSQMLYCCFCCCFPQSCSIRTQDFLTAVCSTAYQWTGGISPVPEVHKLWDFKSLEPDESGGVSERERKQKESGASLTLLDSMFSSTSQHSLTAIGSETSKCVDVVNQASVICSRDYTALTSHTIISQVDKDDSGHITDRLNLKCPPDPAVYTSVRESHAVYESVELKQCVFNVWGNSPLVQHYVNTHRLKQNVGHDLLVKRTQINKLPHADSVTYHDVLRQAQQRSSSQQRALCSLWRQHSKELANLRQKLVEEQVQLLRKHKKILSQKNVVHKLCQLLVPPAKGEEENKTRSEQLLAFHMTLSATE
ncbi:protein FAM227A-like isoform X1 [Hoplias malabaricus]|uniref:protein FAM227A-like isoform X1 n=1 Tax=Hoplias malabaricus TaxID=27720 RepID=UPI0034634BAD